MLTRECSVGVSFLFPSHFPAFQLPACGVANKQAAALPIFLSPGLDIALLRTKRVYDCDLDRGLFFCFFCPSFVKIIETGEMRSGLIPIGVLTVNGL